MGRLVAHKVAARGSHVVIWDIAAESLANTARELYGVGYKVTTYHCDVSDRDMVYGLAEKVKKDVGKVDILINNAGVVCGRPFLDCSDEELERTSVKKVRAGKGKMRGRKYKRKKSILFIVSKDDGFSKSASNVAGANICLVDDLDIRELAPGADAGRLTIWSKSAFNKLGELYG